MISLTGTVLRSTWVAGYKAGPDFIKNDGMNKNFNYKDLMRIKIR